ncbi:MAG TPA: DUF3048 domain-containing protein [Acidimicrobiales bacterium]|nr:DUF3048 domain-containing protein [Acidimicrobiales bacterium]
MRIGPSHLGPLQFGPALLRPRWWLLAGAAGAVLLAGCSSGGGTAKPPKKTTTTTAAPTTTTTSTVPVVDCPLTGSPVPGGGGIPQRPALAVKVTNYVAGRPQSGLDKADIVFEEPVEGGITRFAAVFQCQGSQTVGPVRSARNIDIGILGQFGHPLLAHVGGINPVIANIDASPITNVDLGAHASLIQHPSGRRAPYDTYTSTTAIWAAYPTNTTPPPAVFTYSATPPAGGGPVATVSIPFSSNATVVWKYNTQLHAFQRYYGTKPDTLSTGAQNTAANVVVQFVQVTYGPWLENETGGLEVQANLYQDASGPALVFRSGQEIPGTWSRSTLGQPTQFVTNAGAPITLQPGQTWVELVPTTVKVTANP